MNKYILDENLSKVLAGKLSEHLKNVIPVRDIELPKYSDINMMTL